MPGGIVFTINGATLWISEGTPLVCSSCGEDAFNVTLRFEQPDRIECSNSDCGQPVTADEIAWLYLAGH